MYKGRGSTLSETRRGGREKGVNLLRSLTGFRFIGVRSMQCVSRGFHAVTKTPVRPAYLPCSKTREGVYPAVKVKRKFSGIRFRGQPLALSSDCAVRENPLCCSGSVVQIELCCAASQSGNCGQLHTNTSQKIL